MEDIFDWYFAEHLEVSSCVLLFDELDQYATPHDRLYFIAGTPPYFHDGRVSTLEALIEQNADRMGRTSHLSPEDRAALVAFLRTL